MMLNKNLPMYTNFFTITFFVLNTCTNLVKYENNLYFPTDNCHYSNQTEIELFVSGRIEYNLNFNKLNTAPKQATDFTYAHIDFLAIHKYWLIHYHNCVLVQLKSFDRTFIPNKQFISILQNMWHHSSFESGNLVFG